MKNKMIFSLIMIKFLLIDLTYEKNVVNLKLIDINNSSLSDNFPLIYTCTFSVHNLKFSILFQRITNSNIYLNKSDVNKYYYYESVSINVEPYLADVQFSSNSILYLSQNSYMSDSFQIKYETIMTIFKKLTNSTALQPYLKIEINSNLIQKRDTDSNNKYIAIDYATSGIFEQFNLKRAKRNLYEPTEYKLVVETCVEIHYDVYIKFQTMFKKKENDYIRIYLSIYFAHLFDVINTIYKQVNNELFNLEVEFVKLTINHEKNSIYEFDLNSSYLDQLNTRFFLHYFAIKDNKLDCDHIVFFHNYKEEHNIAGMTASKFVCQQFGLVSSIFFQMHAANELVVAHEMLHNLGAHLHDDQVGYGPCKRSLMNSHLIDNHRGYLISKCAIKQLEDSLFYKSKLKEKYQCLIKENNKEKKDLKMFNLIGKHESPGYFYSLSDQCKIFTLESTSFAIGFTKECSKRDLRCIYNQGAIKVERVLDGTICGSNRICHAGECVPDFNNYDTSKPYLKSALLLREICPQGPSQIDKLNFDSSYITQYILNNNSSFNLNFCSDLVNNPRINFSCSHNFKYGFQTFPYSYVCCESCAKANLKKCKDNKCKTTCESFDKNPCYNNGECITNKTALELNKAEVFFYCECADGFRGDLCLTFNPCDSKLNPCGPNEYCQEYGELGQYYCLCSIETTAYLQCNMTNLTEKYYNWTKYIKADLTFVIKEKIRYHFNNSFMIAFILFFISLVFKLNLNNKL